MRQPYIDQLIFVQTGSYNPMGIRPYTARATGSALSNLFAQTDQMTNLDASSLAPVSGQIIRPSTATTGTLSIANGWQENRLMFIMRVVYPSTSNFDDGMGPTWNKVDTITGWTDHNGDPSFSGRIDPRTEMHIDRIISTKERVANNATIHSPLGTSLFIPQQPSTSPAYTLRPRDVAIAAGNLGLDDPTAIDFRNSLPARPAISALDNDMPSTYMSKLFKGFRMATSSGEDDMGDLPSLMSTVANDTAESGSIDNEFLMSLNLNTQLAEGQFFTYGELAANFDGTTDNTIVVPVQVRKELGFRDIGFGRATANDSEEWGGSNNETLIATMLSTGVPAIAMSSLLTQCAFTVTNATVDGKPFFQWVSPPQSFIAKGEDLTQRMNYFEDRFLNETFRYVTNGGYIAVSLSYYCDLATAESHMEIQVDGGDRTPFVVPNFVGGMITPVFANQRQQLYNLADQFSGIFNEMMDEPTYVATKANDREPFDVAHYTAKPVTTDNQRWSL